MKSIGSVIKENRLKKGLTLKELGKMVSLTQGHLSNIENNHRKASKEDLIKLSKVLDIDLSKLILNKGYWNDIDNRSKSDITSDFDEFNYDIYINIERSKRHQKLEEIFDDNNNLYINDSLLSEEEKYKAIEILQLVFNNKKENYPSIEDVEKEIELEAERKIRDRKLEILEELVELGEISEEEADNFDLDFLELAPKELLEIKEPWRR